MKEELARKASKWWADQLRGQAKLDNGDTSEAGMFTALLAVLAQGVEAQKRGTSDADKFEQALYEALLPIERDWFSFGCDYGPDHFLSEAAKSAGVNLGMGGLPWKTMMWITRDSVSVACGYHAQEVEL